MLGAWEEQFEINWREIAVFQKGKRFLLRKRAQELRQTMSRRKEF